MPLHTKKGELTFRTWIACGFGIGYAPRAPGTFATFFLAGIYGYLIHYDPQVRSVLTNPVLSAVLVVAACILGVYLTGHAEKFLGRDAGSIVWDEFVGFAIAVWFFPELTWTTVLGAFLLFRFFDITKIPPARAAEKLPGGWGVIADDVVAGIYANLVLRALPFVITNW